MINAVRTVTSQLNSAALSNTGGIDATQTTTIATADSKAVSASTRASSVAVNTATADSKGESASTRASSVAVNTATADSKGESASTRASSVAVNTATADSKAVSTASAGLTRNMAWRDIGSVTDSDTGLRTSTAGIYGVAGTIYNKAASSAVFTLSGTTLTSSQVVKYLLTLDVAGSGVATQGNIASTSAGCSLPATPAGACPVGQVIVVAGASNCVPGTTTFSETVSAGGSVVVTELMGVS